MKLINRGTLLLSLAAGVILILISLVFTANFFFSLTTGYLSWFFAAFGIINDFGKVIFLPAILYSLSKNKVGHAGYFILLWSVCFMISLVASQSFDLNKKNEIKNKTLVESSEYQRQTDLFNSSKDTITTLKSDIANLKESRANDEKKIIDRYAPLITTARKLNMLTINVDSVAEISKRLDAEIKNLDVSISDKEKLLIKEKANLSNVNTNFATVGTTVEHTEGLIAFSQWLSSLFGGDPDKVIGWFYIVKNVFSEFLALGLLLLGGLELKEELSDYKLELTSPDSKPKKNLEPITDSKPDIIARPKNSNVIPMAKKDSPIVGVKDSEYRKYLEFMYKNKKGDIAPGYGKIHTETKIPLKKCRLINGYLQESNVIKVENRQSIIIRSKENLA